MPSQMRILILSLCRKGGGFEHYTAHILEHLTLPYTLYQSRYINPEAKIKNAKSIPTYQGNISFLLNSLFILPFLLLRFAFIARRYDALYLPHFHFWNLPFMLLFRLQKKPVIYTEHDGIVHFGDMRFQQPLINLCLKTATHIIFLTHYVKSLVPQRLLRHKYIAIIPHGIFDFQGLSSTPKAYTPKPTLLFFGRVSKYKGIELLLEAMRTIPLQSFHKLIIAGKSSYTYSTEHLHKELLAKLEIIDEFLPQERITELFNEAHILIMPYLEASQSGVAAIAIANAMPTICTDVGGLKEQFIVESQSHLESNAAHSSHLTGGGGQHEIALSDPLSAPLSAPLSNAVSHPAQAPQACALLCQPDTQSLESAILRLCKDSALYQSLSQNATIRASELKWHNITARIERVIQDI